MFGVCKIVILHLKANGLCSSMHGLHEHYIITGCKLEQMTTRYRINEVLKCISVLYVMDWKSTTCSEFVCVCVCVCFVFAALVIQHAPYYTAIRGLSGSTTLFTLSHKSYDFWKKKLLDIKCFFILSTICIWIMFHSEKNSAKCCHKYTQVFT